MATDTLSRLKKSIDSRKKETNPGIISDSQHDVKSIRKPSDVQSRKYAIKSDGIPSSFSDSKDVKPFRLKDPKAPRTPRQRKVANFLRRHGVVEALWEDLAKHLDLPRGTVLQIARTFEERGLLRRETLPGRTGVRLTWAETESD